MGENLIYRTEIDSLGEKKIPAQVYYGIQTQRALENFPVSGIKEHPNFIKAYIFIKKAAALSHVELDRLDKEIGDNITKACDEILEGKLQDQFVIDVFQAGAGTSFNMNINEVVANRALEIMGESRGDYKKINPNDHVNMAQSTNDTFPTAMHIATLLSLEELYPILNNLRSSLIQKGNEFKDIIKSGRTHLQDAVPTSLGFEFLAYGESIKQLINRIKSSSELLEELAIGGTAVGTGVNAHPKYHDLIIKNLKELTGLKLKKPKDLRRAMQSMLGMSAISSSLKELALELIRIANDLRLLSSGPTAGLAEIKLPAVQPGSSIMPGKVNPVILECLNMVAFQIVGNDLAVSMAVQAGQLELNVMMPVIIHNILQSIQILTNYLPNVIEKCILGIVANQERCSRYLDKNTALATFLNPYIGYLEAAKVAKESLEKNLSIYELVLQKGLLTEEELNKIFDPKFLTGEKKK
ncbi:MAG: aspartate ammonia-lyase [Candidatus Helarchaeota archaeon]|nr:aspartate ammonia-lyase [Candidatus Helarchaeota archaeon]